MHSTPREISVILHIKSNYNFYSRIKNLAKKFNESDFKWFGENKLNFFMVR